MPATFEVKGRCDDLGVPYARGKHVLVEIQLGDGVELVESIMVKLEPEHAEQLGRDLLKQTAWRELG